MIIISVISIYTYNNLNKLFNSKKHERNTINKSMYSPLLQRYEMYKVWTIQLQKLINQNIEIHYTLSFQYETLSSQP